MTDNKNLTEPRLRKGKTTTRSSYRGNDQVQYGLITDPFSSG